MRKALSVLLLAALAGTAGCARNRAADEFAVTRNAPLIVPPDFTLAPPVAGTSGLSAADAQQQAVEALFGGPAPRSPGETSLLNAAGRETAQQGIRSTAWDPDTRVVDKGPTTIEILSSPPANTNVASAQ
jgi:hypothetical protein